jgi:hypothetical protein
VGGRGTGAHRWPRNCRICGEVYILTNWMRIWPWESFWLVHPSGVRTVIAVNDKHERSCARKRKLEAVGPAGSAWASEHQTQRRNIRL